MLGFTNCTQTCCSCRVVSKRRVSLPDRRRFCHKRFNQLSQSRIWRLPGLSSLCALCFPVKPPQGTRGAGAGCYDRIAGFHSCGDCRGELHPCFIPQSTVYAPGAQRVYTHCMRRIAVIA